MKSLVLVVLACAVAVHASGYGRGGYGGGGGISLGGGSEFGRNSGGGEFGKRHHSEGQQGYNGGHYSNQEGGHRMEADKTDDSFVSIKKGHHSSSHVASDDHHKSSAGAHKAGFGNFENEGSQYGRQGYESEGGRRGGEIY